MAKRKKSKALDWKRCECGCKGDSVSVGPLSYWMHDNNKGDLRLYAGHGFNGVFLDCYTSFKEADCATKRHAEPKIKKILVELKMDMKALQL